METSREKCWKKNKESYGTRGEARNERNRRMKRGEHVAEVYNCEFCGGWHIN